MAIDRSINRSIRTCLYLKSRRRIPNQTKPNQTDNAHSDHGDLFSSQIPHCGFDIVITVSMDCAAIWDSDQSKNISLLSAAVVVVVVVRVQPRILRMHVNNAQFMYITTL